MHAHRVIGRVDSAQQSIISVVTSSTTANKPDLSVVTELKSIITDKNLKIVSLATLVNGQVVLLENLTKKVSVLTERVDQLPSALPSLSQEDRALLSSQPDLLTSQGPYKFNGVDSPAAPISKITRLRPHNG